MNDHLTKTKKKKFGWRGPVLSALGAIALAYISGLAPWSVERVGGLLASPSHAGNPVSYSVAELNREPCESGGAFVPEPAARAVLKGGPPADWPDLYKYPGAAFVGSSGVEVSIQGESNRTITLTGISFKKKNLGVRPNGIAFRGQCGGGAIGRFIVVDLDSSPPKLVSAQIVSHRAFRPIRFPWTVSATDPLLLDVSANTQRCFCEWWAEIPWVSGAKRGVIRIGNPGDGFRLTSDHGLPSYVPSEDGWAGLAQG